MDHCFHCNLAQASAGVGGSESDLLSPGPGLRRYKMHGVSHLSPDDLPPAPPPTHHGVRQLIGQHPLAYQSRHASMESIGYNMTGNMEQLGNLAPPPAPPTQPQLSSALHRPVTSPPQPPRPQRLLTSSASSMIDLSQSQIRLSPLERTTSHISLNMYGPRPVEAAPSDGGQSSGHSQLSRHMSQAAARSTPGSQGGARPKMTRSQSHISAGSASHLSGGQQQPLTRRPGSGDPLNLGQMPGSEHLDRFLASVERTNAETEMRLSDDYQSGPDLCLSRQTPASQAREARPGGQVNLRRGRTISSRWHSMESLDSVRSQSGARASRVPANQQSIPVEVHRERPRSRDSFGPKGFTSMVSLGGVEPRATSSPIGPPLPVRNKKDPLKKPLIKTESFPDNMSVQSSCSCDTDLTTSPVRDTGVRDETIPRPVMTDSKKTKIEYLGSVPIDQKATDLNNLQHPMKNLYFKSIEMKNMGHQQLPGTMEVSETGLKVNYIRELHKGVQEIFNPFPTIAVWAAVKFVVKKEQDASGDIVSKFAFLPLIADPEDGGKTELFYPLSPGEAGLAAGSPSHPALFAAVMRKAGVAKQLECHGFVCDSPEEAILMAANLYQALLETMKRNKRAGSASQVRNTTSINYF